MAPHLPEPGDAVGDQPRPEPGRPSRPRGMDVHVPEAGDEVPAAGVDHPGVVGDGDRGGRADLGDPISPDDDRPVREEPPVPDVDHGRVGDRQRPWPRAVLLGRMAGEEERDGHHGHEEPRHGADSGEREGAGGGEKLSGRSYRGGPPPTTRSASVV